MNDEEINRAIAEHIGADDRWLIVKRGYFYRPHGHGYTSCECNAWVLPLVEAKKHEYLIGEEKVTLRKATIHNYCGDLNAMHEAENTLENHQLWMVETALAGIVHVDTPIAHATARQRAEAFLRTVGKWRGEE
jgi:hypothetical protein